jgi:hypothetical protein
MSLSTTLLAAQVRRALDYDPETGVFRWKERTPDMFEDGKRSTGWRCKNWNSYFSGRYAGTICQEGYLRITLYRRVYLAHRLAWLIMTGEWPTHHIDHIDGDRSNNKFSNLRVATHAENLRNRGANSNNTSGHKGVYWHKRARKWAASIKSDHGYSHLGLFNDKESAANAYAEAARELHGEFARVS